FEDGPGTERRRLPRAETPGRGVHAILQEQPMLDARAVSHLDADDRTLLVAPTPHPAAINLFRSATRQRVQLEFEIAGEPGVTKLLEDAARLGGIGLAELGEGRGSVDRGAGECRKGGDQ